MNKSDEKTVSMIVELPQSLDRKLQKEKFERGITSKPGVILHILLDYFSRKK